MFQKKKNNSQYYLIFFQQAITVYEHNLTHLMAPKLFVPKQTIRVTRSHRGQDRSSIQKITLDNPGVVSKKTLTAISVVRMLEKLPMRETLTRTVSSRRKSEEFHGRIPCEGVRVLNLTFHDAIDLLFLIFVRLCTSDFSFFKS